MWNFSNDVIHCIYITSCSAQVLRHRNQPICRYWRQCIFTNMLEHECIQFLLYDQTVSGSPLQGFILIAIVRKRRLLYCSVTKIKFSNLSEISSFLDVLGPNKLKSIKTKFDPARPYPARQQEVRHRLCSNFAQLLKHPYFNVYQLLVRISPIDIA